MKIMDWEVSASGYAAVWATENTREALFDAMERRETYATTGPRMVVRFFGGWDFEAAGRAATACRRRSATRKGVPMGGDLQRGAGGQGADLPRRRAEGPDRRQPRPHPDRQGLARRQGRAAREGLRRRLGRADKRKPGADGKLPPVGSTVDVANATWTNTIGAPELITVWKDPDFDPTQRAFYYARVLEIPTPRWTAYDAKRFGIKPLPGTTMTLQERAYTSPIWYTPGG